MASCPKCSKKLRIWNVSQYCPYCGTNIVFHSFLPQFEKDRRIAEMSIGSFRIKLEKIKKAFISGTPQKLKIAAGILPLAGLFIPFGSICINSSLYEKKITFWALDMVYNAFLGEGLFANTGLFENDPVFGTVADSLKIAMLFFLAAALSAVGILLCELLCFAGNKRTGAVITVFSITGTAGITAAYIFCNKVCASADIEILTADVNLLFLISVLLFIFAAFSAIYAIKNPPVYSFREGDAERDDYYRRYKKGKIALMDIPAPIYESEEDRLEKEKLIRGAYQMNEEEKKTDG